MGGGLFWATGERRDGGWGRASLGDGGEKRLGGGGGGGGGGEERKLTFGLQMRPRERRTTTATGHLSSSLLLLPSNLQFRCMKYLVFFGYL